MDEDAWYADSVATVYEMGLMMGDGEGHFNPNGNVTMAEAHALAARISSIYKTGEANFTQGSPWYQVYYDFIDEYNYYSSDDITAPNTAAKRDQFARALFAAIPVRYDRYDAPYKIYDKWDWPVINEILYSDIADIDDGAWAYGEDILRLYKAGILTDCMGIADRYGKKRYCFTIDRKVNRLFCFCLSHIYCNSFNFAACNLQCQIFNTG